MRTMMHGVTGLRSEWTNDKGSSYDINDVWLNVIAETSDKEAIALRIEDLLGSNELNNLNLNTNEAGF